MPTFEVEAMVRVYHVYEEIWDASIDEELLCAREHEVSKFSLKYYFANDSKFAKFARPAKYKRYTVSPFSCSRHIIDINKCGSIRVR